MDTTFITKLQERGIEKVDCLDSSSSTKKNWRSAIQEMQNRLKRKNLDSDSTLDLNLSLKVTTKDDEHEKDVEGDEVDNSLSLSLSSSSSSKLSRLKEGDGSRKHASMASTLHLTL